LNRVIISKDSK